MTCHCRCTLPAVGTNEPFQIPFGGLRRGSGGRTEAMWRLSASFEGRQTKRIPTISVVVKVAGTPRLCARPCAVSALHFRYSHTNIGTPQSPKLTAQYQNCPVLPKLITSCAVASRLPPQVPATSQTSWDSWIGVDGTDREFSSN